MRQTSLILSILFFTFLKAWSQTEQLGQVKGTVLDEESKACLFNASVVLLHDHNAIIVGSTSTNKSGEFLLNILQPGKYTLRVSYLGYRTVTQSISILESGPIAKRDSILMQKTGITLQILEIQSVVPSISIKKDTLEFNAASFKTRKNAVAEELLNKLPGIQIEKDGTIKMNGETIKKILVNGKQFFGPETKLAIQSLPAEMIEKLQIIDQVPDAGGIIKGNNQGKEKVINITIKNNWMSALFGQSSAGAGTTNRYAWNANLHQFKTNEQFSLLSLGHNMNSPDFLTTGTPSTRLTGITSRWHNGINYNRNIGKKIKLNTSYLLSDKRSQSQQNSIRNNLLPDSSYFYNQNSNDTNNRRGNSLNTRLEYKIDTLQYAVTDITLNNFHGDNLHKSSYETIENTGQLINSGSADKSSVSNDINLIGTAAFQKKFKKKNRTLRITLFTTYTNNIQKGFNRSHTKFILRDGALITDSIDQCYSNYATNELTRLSSMYTEPISKNHFLDITYTLTSEHSLSRKTTYSYVKSTDSYTHQEDDLSNSFKSNSILHTTSLFFRAQKNKYDYGIGINMTSYNMISKNITYPSKERQQTFIFTPTVYFNHIFKKKGTFNINYAGEPHLPEITQLQPIFNNSNPIYIQRGNPGLRMSFVHNFDVAYTAINQENQHYLTTNLSISLVRNKIIYANSSDSLGRQISYPVNVNGAYLVTGRVINALLIKNQNMSINTNTSFSLEKDISYINNIKGSIRNYVLTQELSINLNHKELFDLNFTGNLNYSNINYTAQKNNNKGYINYTAYLKYNINFAFGFSLSSNLEYTVRTGAPTSHNQNILMLNMAISKSFFRNKQINLKLHGFDLLNQNVSITRNIGENYIEDVTNNTLRQIFFISFSYYLKPNRTK